MSTSVQVTVVPVSTGAHARPWAEPTAVVICCPVAVITASPSTVTVPKAEVIA